MIDRKTVTPDHIRASARALKEIRPEYEGILDFFQRLFLAQEESKGRIDLDPPLIPPEILKVKKNEEFPLIEMNEFAVDYEAATVLFRTVWQLVSESRSHMSYMALDIDEALESGMLDPKRLIKAMLNGDDGYLKTMADRLKADKQVLGFLAYNAVKPSILLQSEQLSSYLDSESPWPRGFCPVCGNFPGFGTLEGDGGQLHFFCAFCWHKWQSKRMFCPFCERRDPSGYQYFYSENEPEYRVYVCDQCKKYVKTLDARVVHRPIHAPLETIATLHLDLKAREDGLESPPFGF